VVGVGRPESFGVKATSDLAHLAGVVGPAARRRRLRNACSFPPLSRHRPSALSWRWRSKWISIK